MSQNNNILEETNNIVESPNYYAILPANVRYSKITANAKLLYAEITSLCYKEGYCWATSKYFAELYNVKRDAIQKWLSILEDNLFIKREIIYEENTKKIIQRRIYIIDVKTNDNLVYKKIQPSIQKDTSPSIQKDTDNKKELILKKNNNLSNKLDKLGSTPENVKKLYYKYLKENKIPIANHNILRTKINEMYQLHGEKWCIDYLTFMIEKYRYIDDKYKPNINTALDLYTKSKSIENLMIKITKQEEIY